MIFHFTSKIKKEGSLWFSELFARHLFNFVHNIILLQVKGQ